MTQVHRTTPISLLCLETSARFHDKVLDWAEKAGVHYWTIPAWNFVARYASPSAQNFNLLHHTCADLVLLAGNSKRTIDMQAQLQQPPAREYILLS